MTAKEFVKLRMPTARPEKHTGGRVKGFKTTHWLIRELGKTMYVSSGETEGKAWKAAKDYIVENETEELQKVSEFVKSKIAGLTVKKRKHKDTKKVFFVITGYNVALGHGTTELDAWKEVEKGINNGTLDHYLKK